MKLYNILLFCLMVVFHACSYESLDDTITNPGEVETEIIECSLMLDLGQNPSGSELTVLADFGTPPYSFYWSNGENTASINNVAPGSYTVKVEDEVGCFSSKTLSWDVELDCNGSFGLLVSLNSDTMMLKADVGSNSGYSIFWSTGEVENIISVESGQSYTVEVINQEGCTLSVSYDVP